MPQRPGPPKVGTLADQQRLNHLISLYCEDCRRHVASLEPAALIAAHGDMTLQAFFERAVCQAGRTHRLSLQVAPNLGDKGKFSYPDHHPTRDPAMAAERHWSKPLAHPITLKDGTRLATLKDAGGLLAERFTGVTKSSPLEHAVALLMQAAGTGKAADIGAATDQVEIVLRDRQLL